MLSRGIKCTARAITSSTLFLSSRHYIRPFCQCISSTNYSLIFCIAATGAINTHDNTHYNNYHDIISSISNSHMGMGVKSHQIRMKENSNYILAIEMNRTILNPIQSEWIEHRPVHIRWNVLNRSIHFCCPFASHPVTSLLC